MMPRERVIDALLIEESDRVPIGEELIWGRVLKEVLGRTPVHGDPALRLRMLASGKRDKLVDREKKDIVDLVKKLKLDIYMVSMNAAEEYTKPVEIEKNKWILRSRNAEDYCILSCCPSSQVVNEIESNISNVESFKEYVKRREQSEDAPDPTSFEVLEHVAGKIGDKVFISSMVGGALPGFSKPWFPVLLRCLYTEPSHVRRLLREETKQAIQVGEILIDAGAEAIISGTDYAGRDGPFISPRMFREFCLPEIKEQVKAFRKRGVFTIQDTDGDIWKIAEDLLIGGGFDAYFAIEPRARMDIAEVKKVLGDRICLWGNVDCAYTLPYGEKENVAEETRRCIDAAAPGGGYILGSSCTIHPNVKPENYFTMLTTARKYGIY